MWRTLLLVCTAFGLSACATSIDAPRLEVRLVPSHKHAYVPRARSAAVPSDVAIAARAAATAQSMVGMPYRWGGHAPGGFDCSGLVYYSYGRAGAVVPRTSQQLLHASRAVPLDDVRVGDLVFFRVAGKLSHVGIYLDDGRFVHAPSQGKRVQIASLRNGYYERNFVRAGRLALR